MPLAAPFVLAFAISFGGSTLSTRDSGPASDTWGGVVHESPRDLGGWLAARGGSYETWAKNPPAAAACLEGRAQPPSPAEREPLLRMPSRITTSLLTGMLAAKLLA